MAVTFDEWRARLETVAAGPLFTNAARRELTALALEAQQRAAANARTRMRTRTGRLRGSIRGEVRDGDHGPEMVLRAGSKTVPYAPIQEEGGTVTAKGGGYLRVPLDPALTAAGVDRFPGPLRVSGAGRFHVRGLGPGGGPPLYLFRSDQDGPAWYRLQKSSTITGKWYLRDAFHEAAERFPVAVAEAVVRDLP